MNKVEIICKCGNKVRVKSNSPQSELYAIKKMIRHEKICPMCAMKRRQLEEERKRNTKTVVSAKACCGEVFSVSNPYIEDKNIIRKIENEVMHRCHLHELTCNQCHRMRKLKHLNYINEN